METKDKNKKKPTKKVLKTAVEKPKKMSKTWEAFLRNKGTGKILDMRAVLK